MAAGGALWKLRSGAVRFASMLLACLSAALTSGFATDTVFVFMKRAFLGTGATKVSADGAKVSVMIGVARKDFQSCRTDVGAVQV